ncbi:MAG: hypothetical protein BWZ09_02712 [Alphaproteobacteria bacterium ADurb.BinA305]|nr:MAG: hypothetical protein BWZ09_02712 [Alphaproteobacteria bacterium ADurb.BinA305]
MTAAPALRLVDTSTATTYNFRGDRSTWARCTINDSTGELSIQSDWGNWAHSWHHHGCANVTEFIGGRNGGDYIAGKLLGRAGCTVFDLDATVSEFRRQVLDERRQLEMDAETARDIWEELGDLDSDVDERGFVDEWMRTDPLRDYCSEPWEHLRHTPSREYRALVDIILPALIAECSKAAAHA